MAAGYIGATIPAKVIRVSGTTLFQLAMMQTGDPLQWVAIAELNGLVDPWIFGQRTLLIPPILPSGTQTGILDSFSPNNARPGDVAVVPLAPVVAPTGTGGLLDFSIAADSQYLPLV